MGLAFLLHFLTDRSHVTRPFNQYGPQIPHPVAEQLIVLTPLERAKGRYTEGIEMTRFGNKAGRQIGIEKAAGCKAA
jgi:hypothetical protein